jgi:hypothetical protein
MEKIPTLFVRDPEDMRRLTREDPSPPPERRPTMLDRIICRGEILTRGTDRDPPTSGE